MEAIAQSMLGMFLRCPHRFERRYLRGEIRKITAHVLAKEGCLVIFFVQENGGG
jgi:hypothetical protein